MLARQRLAPAPTTAGHLMSRPGRPPQGVPRSSSTRRARSGPRSAAGSPATAGRWCSTTPRTTSARERIAMAVEDDGGHAATLQGGCRRGRRPSAFFTTLEEHCGSALVLVTGAASIGDPAPRRPARRRRRTRSPESVAARAPRARADAGRALRPRRAARPERRRDRRAHPSACRRARRRDRAAPRPPRHHRQHRRDRA